MFRKLAERVRNSEFDVRLLVPLLLLTVLVQVVTAIIRITTSYRAFELDLSIVWLGVIAAAFAAFPIVMAVQVGRFIDRGNDALTIWIGSAIIAMASAGFVLWPSAVGLVVVTTVMGIAVRGYGGRQTAAGHLYNGLVVLSWSPWPQSWHTRCPIRWSS